MAVSLKKRPIPENNIEQLRKARGWSMQDLGEMIDKDASYINKLEKRVQGIPVEILQQLARALGVTISEIVSDNDTGAPARIEQPARVSPELRPMIPIYGTAAGSLLRGASQVLEGPIDMVEAPRALENAKGLYGVYIVGSSMEPMYRQGDLIVVSPYRTPRIGDAVVIQERNGENEPFDASVGILAGVKDGKPQLQKLNPASIIEIKSREIKLHKILTPGELLGVS